MLLILKLPARYVPRHYTSEPNNIIITDKRHCQCHVSHHFKTILSTRTGDPLLVKEYSGQINKSACFEQSVYLPYR